MTGTHENISVEVRSSSVRTISRTRRNPSGGGSEAAQDCSGEDLPSADERIPFYFDDEIQLAFQCENGKYERDIRRLKEVLLVLTRSAMSRAECENLLRVDRISSKLTYRTLMSYIEKRSGIQNNFSRMCPQGNMADTGPFSLTKNVRRAGTALT